MSNTLETKQVINITTLIEKINSIETAPKLTVLNALIDSIHVQRKNLDIRNTTKLNGMYIAELTALRHLKKSWAFLTCKF